MGKLKDIMPTDRPPIYTGAGLVRHKAEIVRLAPEEAIAAQIIGAFSLNECFGNDDNGRHNVFWWDEATQAAYNLIGLKNPGSKEAGKYLPEALKIVQAAGQLAIISITALKGENPVKVLAQLAEWGFEMGADAVEIDGSCPTLGAEHPLLCRDIEQAMAVAAAIRLKIGCDPIVGMKVSDLPVETINDYKDVDFDFYDLINSRGGQPVPINLATGRPAIELNGGLAAQSGPIIRDLARTNLIDWTKQLKQGSPHDHPDLLSIGGVDDGYEVYDRVHNMGALMVGGGQKFHRSADIRLTAQNWGLQYLEAAEAASVA